MNSKTQTKKNCILGFIIQKNPNGVPLNTLEKIDQDISKSDLESILADLEKDGIVKRKEFKNPTDPNRTRILIELIEKDKYPKVETIMIGDKEFPRFFHGDMVGAEDLNDAFEALSDYTKSIESRFKKISQEMTDEFWNKLISIFGVMLSIFALIIKFTSTQTQIDFANYSFWDLVLINSAQVLPISIVLLLLIVIFKLLFTNKKKKN